MDLAHYLPPSLSAARKSSRLQDVKVYRFSRSRDCWKHVSERDEREHTLPWSFSIATWNIDFSGSDVPGRIRAALLYLEDSVLEYPLEPCVVLLQEVHAKALPLILRSEWVRKHFHVTPVNTGKWPAPNLYGNVTLIEKSLTVVHAGILAYGPSEMQRTAVITDVKVRALDSSGEMTVRVMNTHLESLSDPGMVFRLLQLELCGKLLEDKEVNGGVLGGDLNAIDIDHESMIDREGLRDPGRPKRNEKEEETFTWGYQSEHETQRFPPGRLDKVVYTPDRGFTVSKPMVFGRGARTENGKEWISDHFGLLAEFHVLR